MAAVLSSGAVASVAIVTSAGADPVPPTITGSPAPNPGNSRLVTWSFTVPGGGGQVSCRLTVDPVVGGWRYGSYQPCTSPVTYDLAGGPDGTYTFNVRKQPSEANNDSVPATSTYVLDTIAPVIIGSTPTSPGNKTTVSWGFTGESGSTFKCQVSLEGQPAPGFSSCSSGESFRLGPDGTYTFTVEATDKLGNTGPPASATYTLDTVPPPVPTITAEPPSPGRNPAVSWSFTAPGSASTLCQLSPLESVSSQCTSPKSYTLSSDGTYVFTVWGRDAAGNVSEPRSSSDFVLDMSPPSPPEITGTPGAVGRNTEPKWSFTAEQGTSTFCQLAPLESGPTRCDSPKVYALATDGTYTFSVYAMDGFDRKSTVASDTYVLDRVAPAPPVITELASPQNNAMPTWRFTAEEGAVATCRLLRAGTVVDSGCSTDGRSATYSLSQDGVYTFSVFVTDAAGNVSNTKHSRGYELDTTGPAPPVITGGPGVGGNLTAVEWTFTTTPGASISCQLKGPGLSEPAFDNCTSPAGYTLTDDGLYTFSVYATDALGNRGTAASVTYQLDREAPVAPTITSAPKSPANDASPRWVFTAPESGGSNSCELRREASDAPARFIACDSPTDAAYEMSTDGAYIFSVRTTDAAGNVGPAATSRYVLDRVAPAAPTITSAPTSPGNATTATWKFRISETGATGSCQITTATTATAAFGPCTTDASATFSLTSGDGVYTFSVRATDAAGNVSPATSATYRLDTVAPAAPVITAAPASPGSDTSPSWSFTVEPGTSAECRLEGGAGATADWTRCSRSQTYRLSEASGGTYVFSVRSTDAAGNLSPTTRGVYLFEPAASRTPGRPVPPATATTPTTTAPGGETGAVQATTSPATPTAQPRPAAVVPAAPILTPPPFVAAVPPAPVPAMVVPIRPAASSPETSTRPAGIPPTELNAGDEIAAPLPAPLVVEAPSQGVAETIRKIGVATVKKSAFPFLLLVIVVLFLLVQDRIDRRDPKLALAAVYRDPDLDFRPPPSRRLPSHD